jgi:hypothetical protein
MNSDAELAAAKAAMANAMQANAKHLADTEADVHAAYTDAGHSFVEQPSTPDDVAVQWTGESTHPPYVTLGNDVGPIVGSTDDLSAG